MSKPPVGMVGCAPRNRLPALSEGAGAALASCVCGFGLGWIAPALAVCGAACFGLAVEAVFVGAGLAFGLAWLAGSELRNPTARETRSTMPLVPDWLSLEENRLPNQPPELSAEATRALVRGTMGSVIARLPVG